MLLQVDWRFTRAVRVGARITGRVEIVSARRDKPVCTLAVSVRDEAGEICLDGFAVT